MYFDDRLDAARQLADALRHYRGMHPLVLAIPRGAVPMARVVADMLDGDLDVVLVRKLGAPYSAEFAIGSVDESGWTYVADYAREEGVDERYLERERREQLARIETRRALYTPGRRAHDPKGRIAIVIDDGLATGATMIAALHSVRAHAPAKLVCAVPVASRESLLRIGSFADEIVCLSQPPGFHAVGQFYRRFDPVSDEDVAKILAAGETKLHPKPIAEARHEG
jgi:putative phosphoribosyl transferase